MSAKIDIMTFTTGPLFVANNTVNEVPMALAPAAGVSYAVWKNADPTSVGAFFQPMDHMRILSIALRIPFCFTIGTGIPTIGIVWRNSLSAVVSNVREIGTSGALAIPLPDTEIPLDIFVPFAPANHTIKASLELGFFYANISQIGVPASLHGTTQAVQVALKILHNEYLIP